jgi:alginate O-acetyltransferase complex protein AlgI
VIFNTWAFGLFGTMVVLLYWLAVRHKWRPYFLMLAGTVFYAWAIPVYTLLIFTLGAITYATASGLLTIPSDRRRLRITVAAVGIAASVGALAFFKYGKLFSGAFNLHGFPAIAVPLAISFFTFEFVHFLTDVYLGKITSISPRDFALFTLFFPTMIAGPIKRYEQFTPQIAHETFSTDLFVSATYRIALGLAKKSIIADSMTPLTMPLLQPVASANSGDYIIAILAYTAKIYFDFTGYSDIAIGVATLLGYRVPENFDRPYRAASIADFWRRWHMSLSSWIRDYLFIPLGGSRKNPLRTVANLGLVMAVAGLWHGAAWHFVVWGLWHGAGLAVHRTWSWLTQLKPNLSMERSMLRRFGATATTFAFVALGWVLFASPTIEMAGHVYRGLISATAGATTPGSRSFDAHR